jgi:hypothetical protein
MEKHFKTFGLVGNRSKLQKKPGKWQFSFFLVVAAILTFFGAAWLLLRFNM